MRTDFDSFQIRYIEITTAAVVPRGGPEKPPRKFI